MLPRAAFPKAVQAVAMQKKKARPVRALRVPMVEMVKDVPWFKVEGHPPKFAGQLKQPIVIDQPLPSVLDDLMGDIFGRRLDKLRLLLEHYGIEDNDDRWLFLSLRLACALVPGFKVTRKGPGRPGKWKTKSGDIIAAIQAEMKSAGVGVGKAIDRLKEKDPGQWASFNEPRYFELLRPLRKSKSKFQ
jgi:hypothetical protein